tara:strand:- start:141 stop:740 length:600 start_codon:yes stop_codon:yes gene_type:complete
MILSFDIGIKNLSYCVMYKDETYDSINKNNIKIVDWGIIQLIEDGVKCKGVPLDKITTTLYNKLHNIFIDYDISKVLLENQPVLKNPVMKSIQMIIYGYFAYEKNIMGREIEYIKLINASNKLKLGKNLKEINNSEDILKIKSKYTRNKKLAIIYTNHFLRERLIVEDYEKYNDIFNNHKKKDDLADAFLQGLYFIENN